MRTYLGRQAPLSGLNWHELVDTLGREIPTPKPKTQLPQAPKVGVGSFIISATTHRQTVKTGWALTSLPGINKREAFSCMQKRVNCLCLLRVSRYVVSGKICEIGERERHTQFVDAVATAVAWLLYYLAT